MDREFPPNSKNPHRPEPPQEEPKKIEKVVSGSVVQRKRPMGRRIVESVFGGTDGGSIMTYVVGDVLLPAFRDMIQDAVIGATEQALGRPSSGRSRSGYRPSTGPVSYDRYGSSSRPRGTREEPRRSMSPRARANHDFREIILETRAEAQTVLERLWDYTERFDNASVSDLYQMVGITPAYTDEKWGWYKGDLAGADVRHLRGGGYLLDVPEPNYLE